MPELSERTGYRLVVIEDPDNPGDGLGGSASYSRDISAVADRARAVCQKGEACCLGAVVTDFKPGRSATVEVSCDSSSCPNPRLVGETAMNRVLSEGQKATYTEM